MKHLTVKARITLLCTLLAATVAALALIVVLVNEQRMVSAYFQDTLTSTVQLARDDIRRENGRLEIDRNLDDLPNVRVAIYNLDGDLIYGQQRFELPFEQGALRQARGAGDTRWMALDSRLSFEDGADIWLRCYISADAVQSMRGVHVQVLMALFPALILLAALGGWGVARRSIMPLSRIIRTAEGIADGSDLKKRIGMSGARDEIYQTARVFDDMLQRLDGAFERERQFTSDASHELRTPVAAIMLQSEGALADDASDADRLEALGEIRRQSGHLSVLIQRLLALARLDARQALGDVQEVDLAMLGEVIAESMEDRAGERGMRVSVEHDDCAPVRGDHTMLTQAALNLLENAVNYGREGGDIRIEVCMRGDECIFSVEDDGPGIAPEDQKRIFDRFYQADASRHGRGFGLGLPLARRIVELHGGRMELRSAPGAGSRFEMIFPAWTEKEDANA